MTFSDFSQTMATEINKRLGGDVRADVHHAVKNNSIPKTGMMFLSKTSSVSPIIYLEDWYEKYKRGESEGDIASELLAVYDSIKKCRFIEGFDVTCYEKIKDRITYRLINRAANQEMPGEVPHIDYMDLLIVFSVLLRLDQGNEASMIVRNNHMKLWGITGQELYDDAVRNSPRLLPGEMRSMNEVLGMMTVKETHSWWEKEDFSDSMYVVTNVKKSFGAAVILYPGYLESIGQKLRENFFLLPSSVHEMIAVRERYAPDRESLCAMIEEINATQVAPEEVLSNRAYFYNVSEKKLV